MYNNVPLILNIAIDSLIEIMSHLELKDLLALKSCCKKMKTIINDDYYLNRINKLYFKKNIMYTYISDNIIIKDKCDFCDNDSTMNQFGYVYNKIRNESIKFDQFKKHSTCHFCSYSPKVNWYSPIVFRIFSGKNPVLVNCGDPRSQKKIYSQSQTFLKRVMYETIINYIKYAFMDHIYSRYCDKIKMPKCPNSMYWFYYNCDIQTCNLFNLGDKRKMALKESKKINGINMIMSDREIGKIIWHRLLNPLEKSIIKTYFVKIRTKYIINKLIISFKKQNKRSTFIEYAISGDYKLLK